MKQYLTIVFQLCISFSFGQFAIVNDKDSLLNVREDGQLNSMVIDRLPNRHLIYCFDNKGNWTRINYTKKESEFSGYVYKGRYKFVTDFNAFKVSKKSENSITLKKDTLEVIITKTKFDNKKHRYSYLKENPDLLEFIDGKKYWGCDGGMPTTQFEKITIKVGRKIINLPNLAIAGLYQPSLYTAEVFYDKLTDTFFIQTMNSDGAGGYLVIWKVEKGKYKDRLVAYGF